MEHENSRRNFLKKSALITLAGAGLRLGANNLVAGNILSADEPAFTLPELSYAPSALEPHIDAMTMEIHHGKHHRAYVDNLNIAVSELKMEKKTLEAMMATVSTYPVSVRNNGGGHFNHSMFWQMMTPSGGGNPTGPIENVINGTFGSFEAFKNKFNSAALSRFGSGWAWLVTKDGAFTIGSTPNQDNPLMDVSELKGTPLIGMDVWEHAYYLKYQNKRIDYINAWWNVINWAEVNRRLVAVK